MKFQPSTKGLTRRAPTQPLPLFEFVVLMAFMISIVTMATDIMLPALGFIGEDLDVSDPNDVHMVVVSLSFGFAVGQLVVGPLSDAYGRRPVIQLSFLIFAVGCVFSIAANDFAMMLLGRVLQGVGAAAPRIVGIAIIRDTYSGDAMARVTSLMMSAFILVPAVAPSLGQGILFFTTWHYTFAIPLVMSIAAAIWFGLRQPETLLPNKRRALSLGSFQRGIKEVFAAKVAVGYTLCIGFIFGVFLSYLSTSRQVFQETFQTGEMFSIYFGIGALSIGCASLVNSFLVTRLGMRKLTLVAISSLVIWSTLFLILFLQSEGQPRLVQFIMWQLGTFFCIGILFGNLNALAMEPLGAIAGLGAALVGSVSTVISLPIAWLIGQLYDGTVIPLVGGFCTLGTATLLTVLVTERCRPNP